MLRPAILLLLALANPMLAPPALGQQAAAPETGGSTIRRLYDSLKPQAPEPRTADFVRQSRPGELQYRPFDPTPEKVDKRKTAEEMQRASSQLEAAAAANRRKAARVKIPN